MKIEPSSLAHAQSQASAQKESPEGPLPRASGGGGGACPANLCPWGTEWHLPLVCFKQRFRFLISAPAGATQMVPGDRRAAWICEMSPDPSRPLPRGGWPGPVRVPA